MVSFARVPPRRRRSPDGSDGCASLAFSMPLGLTFALMSGRPGPPFSRAISSRSAPIVRRNSACSCKSFNTKLFSSVGESVSMSLGGDIPPSSQKTADSGIPASPHESIGRTYDQTPNQRSPRLLPPLPQIVMVGDSRHDLDCARAAGAIGVAVLSGPADRRSLTPHADFVIETIGDLPELLADLTAASQVSNPPSS